MLWIVLYFNYIAINIFVLMSIIIFILIFFLFISYSRLSCGGHWFYFLFLGVVLRVLIPIPLAMDYFVYNIGNIYDYNFYGIEDIIIEPVLKIVYNFFYLFFQDKTQTVHFLYWLNFATCTYLFYRISKYHIPFFKKMLLFSFFYFLFTYVLLRNGIPYLLVFIFFYELNNTEGKLKKLIVASFFHATAALIFLIKIIFEIKLWHLIVYGLAILVLLAILAFNNVFVFDYIINKFRTYSEVRYDRSVFHVVWMFFIFGIFLWSFIENIAQSTTLFFITLMIVYIVFNYLNPVMGYRLSLYILLFYLTLPVKNPKIVKYVPDIDLVSFGLFFLLYINYSSTHYLD
ncbi:MAG: hypothetical protein ACI8RP_000816 [Urechidicola sp.]|jgi:hypothetical protein